MNKYRYITSGGVRMSDRLCDYHLVGGRHAGHAESVMRVRVDDVKLTKYSCDCYSTTTDKRTLRELGAELLVRINWRYVPRNDLIPEDDNEIILPNGLMESLGYRPAMRLLNEDNRQYTWLDAAHAKEHYQNLFKNVRLPETN